MGAVITAAAGVVVAAAVALLFVLLTWRRRVRQRRAYERMCGFWACEAPGTQVICVEWLYQHARRGTKAVVRFLAGGRRQDAWFEQLRPMPGSLMVVRGSIGWGPAQPERRPLRPAR